MQKNATQKCNKLQVRKHNAKEMRITNARKMQVRKRSSQCFACFVFHPAFVFFFQNHVCPVCPCSDLHFFCIVFALFSFFCIIPRFGVHFIACFLHFPCLLMSERRRQNTERKHSAFELMHRRSLHTQQSHFGKPLLRWKVL